MKQTPPRQWFTFNEEPNIDCGVASVNFGKPSHSRVIQTAFMKDGARIRAYKIDNVSEQEFLLQKAKLRALFDSSLKECKKKNLIMSSE